MAFIWPAYRVTNSYFLMPSSIIGIERDGERIPGPWAQFSRAERAVYPVLLSHIHHGRTVTIGEERTAALAGLKCRESARIATEALENRGLTRINRGTSKRTTKSFTLELIEAPRSFPFYRDMLYSGIWAGLGRQRPTAQSLYMAMRFLAKPRPDLDDEYDGWPRDKDEFRDYLTERTEDYCLVQQREILDYAGIARRAFHDAIELLADFHLVEPMEYRDGYAVRIKSSMRMDEGYLKRIKIG